MENDENRPMTCERYILSEYLRLKKENEKAESIGDFVEFVVSHISITDAVNPEGFGKSAAAQANFVMTDEEEKRYGRALRMLAGRKGI